MSQQARIDNLLEMLKTEAEDLFLNYALGIEYLTVSRFTESEHQFKKVIALDVNYIAAYYQLGKLFEAQSQNEQALDYYRAGLEKAKLKKDNKAINEFGEAIFMLED
jgi:Tfp pilus assembly protein PilF